MRHILAPPNLTTLADFAGSNVVIAFDYDGTLAPIAPTPAQARMRPRTRRLLAAIARRYPCIVISGRSSADVAAHVHGVPVFQVAGNHGLEPWGVDAAYLRRVKDWMRRLRPRLAAQRGVVLEDKRYSVTIHYRQAARRRRALDAIGRAVRALHGARVMRAKEAVNLVPRGAPNKSAALDRARRLLVCDRAIYVGDDVTDEDVFFRAKPDRVLPIRVGFTRRSHARYGLRHQTEVDALLEALIALRPRRRTGRP